MRVAAKRRETRLSKVCTFIKPRKPGFVLIFDHFSELEAETGYQGAELRIVDLSSFKSVQTLAESVERDGLEIDIMVYNAAVAVTQHELTGDGWEQTYVALRYDLLDLY